LWPYKPLSNILELLLELEPYYKAGSLDNIVSILKRSFGNQNLETNCDTKVVIPTGLYKEGLCSSLLYSNYSYTTQNKEDTGAIDTRRESITNDNMVTLATICCTYASIRSGSLTWDGATEYVNPSELALHEAVNLFSDRPIGLFLSIGSGAMDGLQVPKCFAEGPDGTKIHIPAFAQKIQDAVVHWNKLTPLKDKVVRINPAHLADRCLLERTSVEYWISHQLGKYLTRIQNLLGI